MAHNLWPSNNFEEQVIRRERVFREHSNLLKIYSREDIVSPIKLLWHIEEAKLSKIMRRYVKHKKLPLQRGTELTKENLASETLLMQYVFNKTTN